MMFRHAPITAYDDLFEPDLDALHLGYPRKETKCRLRRFRAHLNGTLRLHRQMGLIWTSSVC